MSSPPLKSIPLLILAGGRGTRLKDLGNDLPKFLMPISKNLCFADVQLQWAFDQGFTDVILSLGYKGELVKNYCGDGSQWGLKIRYVEDGPQPLGTGGALKKAASQISTTVALTYGDTLLALNCKALLSDFEKNKRYAFMSVYQNTVTGHTSNADFCSYDLTSIAPVIYSKSHPKPEWKFIDYGFLIFSKDFLNDLPQAINSFDLAGPLEEASKQQRLFGTLVAERFWEIGSPEALEDFRKNYLKNYSIKSKS
jgi:NDP-sugar pyrophosphorylase family protein